jgi:hypothetical protein
MAKELDRPFRAVPETLRGLDRGSQNVASAAGNRQRWRSPGSQLVFWLIPSNQVLAPAPVIVPQSPPACLPVLWGDWPRCHIRRHWLNVVRSQTVVVTMEVAPTEKPMAVTSEQVTTRVQRAHWQLSWLERFTRNARPITAQPLTVTIHGLPAAFAHAYGFALLEAA